MLGPRLTLPDWFVIVFLLNLTWVKIFIPSIERFLEITVEELENLKKKSERNLETAANDIGGQHIRLCTLVLG